jgi:hypothetical protein
VVVSEEPLLPPQLSDTIWRAYERLRGEFDMGTLMRLNSRVTPAAVAAALRDFDGDWDRLTQRLADVIASSSEPVTATTLLDHGRGNNTLVVTKLLGFFMTLDQANRG